MKRKIFVLFAIVACIGNVYAAVYSGTCGNALSWELNTSTGSLIISGSGDMSYNEYASSSPWYDYRSSVKTISLPEELTSISAYAFYETKVSSIIIPPKVIHIGKSAFHRCSKLSSITLPESLETLGPDAFGNSNIKNVYYNSDIYHWLTIEQSNSGAFSGGFNLYFNNVLQVDVVIPDNIKTIHRSAFASCYSLKSISIPNSVISIGVKAFYGCINLEIVNLPNYITEINDSAFFSCINIKSITLPGQMKRIGSAAFHSSGLVNIVIPEGVSNIDSWSFMNCKSLIDIVIPNSVTNIGGGTFRECSSLTSIILPDSIKVLSGGILGGCSSLTSIDIPQSVDSIGKGAFAGCSSLTTIKIPNGVRYISAMTFSNCISLQSIILPNSVISIGDNYFKYSSDDDGTFEGCTSLASITLPENLKFIGKETFADCTSLKTITLPTMVSTIEEKAFRNCSVLESITINAPNPPAITSLTFDGMASDVTIYIPCGALSTYSTTTYWESQKLSYALVPTINVVCDEHQGIVSKESSGTDICDAIALMRAIPNEGYSFIEWSDGNTDNPREISLTQDTTLTAIFAVQKFTITFVDDNDTILSSQIVEYNTIPTPPADPSKQEDAQYTYTFAGWSPTIIPATKDAIYKATYQKTAKESHEQAEIIDDAEVSATPTENYSVIIEWPAVENAATYTIQIFKDGDLIFTLIFDSNGQLITMNSIAPAREDCGHKVKSNTQTSKGWRYSITGLEADATYTYSVTAKDNNESTLFTQSIAFTMPAPQGINNEEVNGVSRKVLRNGQVYILMSDGQEYTIIGNQIK